MGALVKGGPEVGKVGKDIRAQVGHDAFAHPGDEVEAYGARGGQDGADHDQHHEVLVDHLPVVRAEPMVDHASHRHGNGQHGYGRDDERGNGCHETDRVAQQVGLEREQRPQRAASFRSGVGGRARGSGRGKRSRLRCRCRLELFVCLQISIFHFWCFPRAARIAVLIRCNRPCLTAPPSVNASGCAAHGSM